MKDDELKNERAVAGAFSEPPPDAADERRIRRVMQGVRNEVATREVMLFVFVRMWLTALEFGAELLTRRAEKRRS